MKKVGIIGGSGITGGELIRLVHLIGYAAPFIKVQSG